MTMAQNMNPSKRLFHGWLIAASCLVMLLIFDGMLGGTVATFHIYLWESMGWSRGRLSLALAAGVLPMTVAAPLIVGKVVDAVGARKTMLGGCLLSVLGLILIGGISRLWQFSLSVAVLGFGVTAATFIPIFVLLARWFDRRRGAAIGLALMGTGGAVMVGPLSTFLAEDFGWRKSSVLLGIVILLITVLLVLFVVRDRPSEVGQLPDGDDSGDKELQESKGHTLNKALHTPAFWLIAAGAFLAGFASSPIGAYCVDHLQELGHSRLTSAAALEFSRGFAIPGSLVFGLFADRWGARNAFVFNAFLTAAGIAMLMLASPFAALVLFVLFCGVTRNGPLTLTPLVIADCHGLSSFGIIYGLLSLFTGLGSSIGSGLVGIIHSAMEDRGWESAHGYQLVFAPLIVLALMSGYCMYRAKPLKHAKPAAPISG